MAHSWLNHINRFDHFMKIFKIWLNGKLPPTHTHAKKQQQLFIYSQFSDQTHQRESATVLQGQSGSPRGPRSLPVEIRQILAWDSSSWSSVCTQEAKIMTLGKQRCQVEYHAGFRARHKQNSDHDRMPDDYGF